MAGDETPWGRVGDDGTVYVREADGERAVGQYPDATPEEALAYFERKYAELEGQVGLVEQRVRAGAPAKDVSKTIASLTESVTGANAVGDLAALRTRLETLSGGLGELVEKQSAEAEAAVADAVAARTRLVVDVEALAAQDPAKVQWKQTSARLDELFTAWQTQQKEGPRLPKSDADALWKRFSAARSTIESGRRAFFAQQESSQKEVKARKERLAEQAEALAPKGAAGIPDYRRLLDSWKTAGRAGRKVDDALWARFKAAGDVLYGAKAEIDAQENEEFAANLDVKLEILTEAEELLTETDREVARRKLTAIQKRWDAAGKVPRDKMRSVEDRLRKVEAAVKKLEDDHWNRTDPEKQARSDGLASQLADAIGKLEAEIAEAKASGDKRKQKEAEEALAARKVWLEALGS